MPQYNAIDPNVQQTAITSFTPEVTDVNTFARPGISIDDKTPLQQGFVNLAGAVAQKKNEESIANMKRKAYEDYTNLTYTAIVDGRKKIESSPLSFLDLNGELDYYKTMQDLKVNESLINFTTDVKANAARYAKMTVPEFNSALQQHLKDNVYTGDSTIDDELFKKIQPMVGDLLNNHSSSHSEFIINETTNRSLSIISKEMESAKAENRPMDLTNKLPSGISQEKAISMLLDTELNKMDEPGNDGSNIPVLLNYGQNQFGEEFFKKAKEKYNEIINNKVQSDATYVFTYTAKTQNYLNSKITADTTPDQLVTIAQQTADNTPSQIVDHKSIGGKVRYAEELYKQMESHVRHLKSERERESKENAENQQLVDSAGVGFNLLQQAVSMYHANDTNGYNNVMANFNILDPKVQKLAKQKLALVLNDPNNPYTYTIGPKNTADFIKSDKDTSFSYNNYRIAKSIGLEGFMNPLESINQSLNDTTPDGIQKASKILTKLVSGINITNVDSFAEQAKINGMSEKAIDIIRYAVAHSLPMSDAIKSINEQEKTNLNTGFNVRRDEMLKEAKKQNYSNIDKATSANNTYWKMQEQEYIKNNPQKSTNSLASGYNRHVDEQTSFEWNGKKLNHYGVTHRVVNGRSKPMNLKEDLMSRFDENNKEYGTLNFANKDEYVLQPDGKNFHKVFKNGMYISAFAQYKAEYEAQHNVKLTQKQSDTLYGWMLRNGNVEPSSGINGNDWKFTFNAPGPDGKPVNYSLNITNANIAKYSKVAGLAHMKNDLKNKKY